MTPHQRNGGSRCQNSPIPNSSFCPRLRGAMIAELTVTGEAVRGAVDKLIRTGLLEEAHANGSLLAWRRDAEAGPMALRITRQGLEAIGVKDDAVSAPMETGVRPAPERTEIEAPAVKVVASRKRSSDAAGREQAQNKAAPGKAESKAGEGSHECCHHACHPLETALGRRLLRRGGSQEARPRPALGEPRWR